MLSLRHFSSAYFIASKCLSQVSFLLTRYRALLNTPPAPPLAEPVRPDPPPPPPASAHYSISLRGTHFNVSAALLRTDSPNLFTESVLAPPSAQRISSRSAAYELDGDPKLFEVILNHLAGYAVFPLSETQFLTDRATATRNLLKDAETYKLKELERLTREELHRLKEQSLLHQANSELTEGELETRQGCSIFSAM